jgi:hypothetical protein
MSILTDFATNAATSAFSVIGAETLTIGASTVSCIFNEANDSNEFDGEGFEKTKTLSAVFKTSLLPSGTLLEKKATARGIVYRIKGIEKGGTFTTLRLETDTRA